jgi:hypothetical protein
MPQKSIIQSISKYAILSGCVSLVSMISTILIYRLMGPYENPLRLWHATRSY